MAKPASKGQLLADIQSERETLEQFLRGLSEEQLTAPGTVGEWSAKDVMAHLAEWEGMFLAWYAAGKRGEAPHTPAPGFTWGQLPALNQQIYEKHRERSLQEVQQLFTDSHQAMLNAIQSMSVEELFTPGYYAWTKKHALAAYITPNTSRHYRWAITEMRKRFKSRKAPASRQK